MLHKPMMENVQLFVVYQIAHINDKEYVFLVKDILKEYPQWIEDKVLVIKLDSLTGYLEEIKLSLLEGDKDIEVYFNYNTVSL